MAEHRRACELMCLPPPHYHHHRFHGSVDPLRELGANILETDHLPGSHGGSWLAIFPDSEAADKALQWLRTIEQVCLACVITRGVYSILHGLNDPHHLVCMFVFLGGGVIPLGMAWVEASATRSCAS